MNGKRTTLLEQPSNRELKFTRVFDAPRNLVWRAWTDPELLAKWWGPNGFSLTSHEMQFRNHGFWKLTMHGPDGRDYENQVNYVEISEPERIAYKHVGDSEGDGPINFQTVVTFEAESDNQTKLTMHMQFARAEDLKFVVENYGADTGGIETVGRLADYVDMQSRPVVTVTRYFEAPCEKVFDAWVTPEKAAKFLFKTPTGVMTRVEMEQRIGGTFCIVENRNGAPAEHKGRYLAFQRPNRLMFTMEDNIGFQNTIVTIDIRPMKTGCELTLTHEGVTLDFTDRVHGGWSMILEKSVAVTA